MQEDDVFIGTVIWFNNRSGYGFLSWMKNNVAQKDLFTHYSNIEIDGYKTLKSGQKVTFSIGQNNKGQPKAINVKVVNEK